MGNSATGDAKLKYLLDVILALKGAITIRAVKVVFDLMLLDRLLVWPGLIADATLKVEVVLGIHVSLTGALGSKVALAAVALVSGTMVASGVTVVVTGLPTCREGRAAGTAGVVVVKHLGRE